MIETVEISRDTDTVDNTEEETAEKVGTEETQNTISLSKTQTHLLTHSYWEELFILKTWP